MNNISTNPQNPVKQSRVKRTLLLIAAVALLLVVSFFVTAYYITRGKVIIFTDNKGMLLYSLTETDIDLKGTTVSNYTALGKIKTLKNLDIRDGDIKIDEYDELHQALPNCNIRWSVPLSGNKYDDDSVEVKVNSGEDLAMISYFTSLKYVDASSCDEYDSLMTASKENPNVDFVWNVTVDGKNVSSTDISCVIGASATADDIKAIKYLPNIKTVDATECKLYDELIAASKEFVDVSFDWQVNICGNNVPNSAESCVLTDDFTDEDIAKLKFLPAVKELDASNCKNYERLMSLKNEHPDYSVKWLVSLGGKKISSLATKADIHGKKVKKDAVVKALKYLPALEKLDMRNCGLNNSDMESLSKEYPKVKFVWYIRFGRWKVRTDVQVFSTLNVKKTKYDEKTFDPLFTYCTDLVCLDLGHNNIKYLKKIVNLKKLKCLMLGDNHILDISPLESLQELEFVELFSNYIRDFSALCKIPNLYDVNVGYNPITAKNIETLLDLKAPKMIWINSDWIYSDKIVNKVKNAFPQCKISTYAGYRHACGNGWCDTKRYEGYRRALRNWDKVEYFNTWDDNAFVKGAKLRGLNKSK